MMIEKNIKKLRLTFCFLVLTSMALNFIWPITGFRWSYWISRFLLTGIALFVGVVFMASPKKMMIVVLENKQDYYDIESWRLIISGLLIGIPSTIFGIWYLLFIGEKWITKCLGAVICNH